MSDYISHVRSRVSSLPGVIQTWFEYQSVPAGGGLKKILVVEVGFDTDPEANAQLKSWLEEAERTVLEVLQNETTMAVAGLRIVPQPITNA